MYLWRAGHRLRLFSSSYERQEESSGVTKIFGFRLTWNVEESTNKLVNDDQRKKTQRFLVTSRIYAYQRPFGVRDPNTLLTSFDFRCLFELRALWKRATYLKEIVAAWFS